jgi:type IV pilus assembly protein PilX
MRNISSVKRPASQRGAVLVVSLLLLLVMTLLGLGASQSTRLQERMAGNQRDLELAMQGAEASLRAAEALLEPGRSVMTCVAAGVTCEAYEMGTLVNTSTNVALDLARQSDEWWERWGRQYATSADLPSILPSVKDPPEFINERVGELRDSFGVGGPYLNVVRDFHRATARSSGMTNTAEVVVQSTYSRITFE